MKQRDASPTRVPLTTYVDPEWRDAFHRIAEREDRSVAAELRRLVERHLDEDPEKATLEAAA